METIDKYLNDLKATLARANAVDALNVCKNCGKPNEGYGFLKEELLKAMDSFKTAAVSPKSLTEPVTHATFVGGYNALNSLLSIVTSLEGKSDTILSKIKEAEATRAENEQ